ncbi:MAG: beta-N-acetylhexosaminidase [Gammaproteobacteria bacterium]|nr:beta-N-acetylhexosaminidase [Gammaproteobacteria bacterium]
MSLKIGPIVFDLISTELSPEEREILQHPLIGGVIFFSRNFESPEQISQLSQEIRACRKSPILITVDQEGGRVQRFREGFLRLPAMGRIGQLYAESPQVALSLASTSGYLMASEILSVGVDLSFAPVLDIDYGNNEVIGLRAFHQDIDPLTSLAKAFMQGMQTAGMAAVGKHFPGHGAVTADSHLDLPIDSRSLKEVTEKDLVPFKHLIEFGIQGIMAAHILFPQIDTQPAGFSSYWLKEVLRKQLNFQGMIFSDDLNMKGAHIAGDFPDRAQAALEAGCDMVLICNDRTGLVKTIDGLPHNKFIVSDEKFLAIQGRFNNTHQALKNTPMWREQHNYFDTYAKQYDL